MTPQTEWLRDIVRDLKIAISFCTRLRLAHVEAIEGSDLAQASWAIPLAGALVGVLGALAYAIAGRFGIPPLPAAAIAVAATLLVTGALHEDGLADTADGLGGGGTAERKLEIMRDSAIGSYGTAALVLSILLRTAALASLAPTAAMLALIGAHAGARAILPAFMWLVPRARADGLSAATGDIPSTSALLAAALGAVILVLTLGVSVGVHAALCLIVAMIAVAWLALHHLGGQTGDILGALEQVGEIVVLLAAAA
jgi:adenosylcobinamide-GDP ribazoletransferase